MSILLQIIIFIFVLTFLVVIHELGHLLAAKWAKVKVDEFGVGYPPRAFKLFYWGKILFSLNWIPVGGFVKMFGEDGPDGEDDGKSEKESEDGDGLAPFYKRSRSKRMVIILAGVTVNLIFGFLALVVFFMGKGIPTFIDTARIAAVVENSPAAIAGIKPGTEIRQVILPVSEGQVGDEISGEIIEVNDTNSAAEAINAHLGEEITLAMSGACDGLDCQESLEYFTLTPRTDEEIQKKEGAIGVAFDFTAFQKYGGIQMFVQSLRSALEQTLMMILLIPLALANVFVQLFQGSIPQDVAGPIGIADQAISNDIFADFFTTLHFMAIISLNLAVINMLPIPALDGGRAFFIILENFIGKKRVQKFEGYTNYGGMLLLLALIILISAADVSRLINR